MKGSLRADIASWQPGQVGAQPLYLHTKIKLSFSLLIIGKMGLVSYVIDFTHFLLFFLFQSLLKLYAYLKKHI